MDAAKIKTQEILDYVVYHFKQQFGKDIISVILFGSYARGTATARSDIDLIVVLPKFSSLFGRGELIKDVRKKTLLKFGKVLDVQLFTPEEVVDNFESFSPIFSTLVLGYQILYDQKDFFRSLFKEFVSILGKHHFEYGEKGEIWNLSQIAKKLEISL